MSGWHYHPKMYPTMAWRDDRCPNPSTAVRLPADDERVVRAMSYPAEVTS